MPSSPPEPTQIELAYQRQPDDVTVFQQELVIDRPDLKVTFMPDSPFDRQLKVAIEGRPTTIAEPGSPLIWFVFPGTWYDIGAFHLRDGTFTGYYTNFIRPPTLEGHRWKMVDLCLDLWLGANDSIEVLDRDEFEAAVSKGWIDSPTAKRVELELAGVRAAAEAGEWPPEPVRDLDLPAVHRLRQSGSD